MKIALSLSGQPRFVKQCFENIKANIIEPNNITDIYVHIWAPKLLYQLVNNPYGTEQDIEDIRNLYKPTKTIIEEPKEFEEIVPKDSVYYLYNFVSQSMFYSIKRGMEMIDESYDCYCRLRFDLQFFHPIKFSDYNMAHANIPTVFDNRVCDHFGFGDITVKRAYENALGECKNYYLETNKFTPEEILEMSFNKNKVPITKHGWAKPVIYRG